LLWHLRTEMLNLTHPKTKLCPLIYSRVNLARVEQISKLHEGTQMKRKKLGKRALNNIIQKVQNHIRFPVHTVPYRFHCFFISISFFFFALFSL